LFGAAHTDAAMCPLTEKEAIITSEIKNLSILPLPPYLEKLNFIENVAIPVSQGVLKSYIK